MQAVKRYSSGGSGIYSVQPAESSSFGATITPEEIDQLAQDINSTLDNVLRANSYVRNAIVTDDIIGKTYESIEANINTGFRLSFPNYEKKRNKSKKLEEAKRVIDDFNRAIDIKRVIRDAITLTYAEGNYIMYLRIEGDSYAIDRYPLGIAEISDYTYGGKPIVLLNISELRNRLSKTYEKTKKNKPLFFKDIEEEVKVNYPKEVYDAFKANDEKAKLDPRLTGVMRWGNLGRKYGVTPMFRALKPSLMLANLENSDYINSKAKAKKVLHQILRKELLTDRKSLGYAEAVKSHEDLYNAWQNKTVLYTSPPYVEKLVYVEPGVVDTTAEKINIYRSKIMTTLGIGFVDTNVANFSVANISLDQLMRVINAIGEQLETVLRQFYSLVLESNNIDLEYLPEITIIDSEALDFSMRKDLSTYLYSTLNVSRETALECVGISYADEVQRRTSENEDGDDEIFYPRSTSYTVSKEDKGVGRPQSSPDGDKQEYDKNRSG